MIIEDFYTSYVNETHLNEQYYFLSLRYILFCFVFYWITQNKY